MSRWLVGSSSKIVFARCASATAIHARCRSPVESSAKSRVAYAKSDVCSSASRTIASSPGCGDHFHHGRYGSRPFATSSLTVNPRGTAPSDSTTAIRRPRSRGASDAIGNPSTDTVPAAGSTSPVSTRRSDVFPAPLGPTIASNSPGRTSNETPATIVRFPYAIATSRAVITRSTNDSER